MDHNRFASYFIRDSCIYFIPFVWIASDLVHRGRSRIMCSMERPWPCLRPYQWPCVRVCGRMRARMHKPFCTCHWIIIPFSVARERWLHENKLDRRNGNDHLLNEILPPVEKHFLLVVFFVAGFLFSFRTKENWKGGFCAYLLYEFTSN